MTKNEAVQKMKALMEERAHFMGAYAVMSWDERTGSPSRKGVEGRAKTSGFLAQESFKRLVSPDMKACLECLDAHRDELSGLESAMLREYRRVYNKNIAVPPERVGALTELTGEAEAVWMEARDAGDFARMAPYFEKIFALQREMAGYYGYAEHPYDALLDDYEEGLTVRKLDEFFGALRAELVPLLKKVSAAQQPDTSFLEKSFTVDRQALLSQALARLVGYDMDRGQLGTTQHPFTISVNRHDVRVTTHYYERDLLSAVFSTVHECGHGIYDQGMDPALEAYGLNGGASMSVHESQSRSYENVMCRSRAFVRTLLPRLQTLFPREFSDVSAEALYRAVNVAKASLIRVEADELTYCLHILVRYELEKLIMEDSINVRDLPALWNEKMQEILGVTPPDDAQGVLQDTHWSSGLLGYFPSYALGSAYSAQFMHAMGKEVDIAGCLAMGDFAPINAWLGERIHRHGMTLTAEELMLRVTGEPFTARYFVDYLKEKYGELYA